MDTLTANDSQNISTGDYSSSGTWTSWKGDTTYPPSGGSWVTLYTERKEVNEMRGLFYVVVVDYQNDTILEDGLYIAKDAETAKIKALSVFADTYDLDDLDVICQRLGDIRKKKEIQEVKIVKE